MASDNAFGASAGAYVTVVGGVDGSGLAQRAAVTAKGTQGALGFSTQDLKDAGRATVNFTLDSFPTAAAAETLMTMTRGSSLAPTATGTSFLLTTGKKLRLVGYTYTAENGGSTPVVSRLKFRVRGSAAGATSTASPLQHLVTLAVTNVAKQTTTISGEFPEGMEFNGDGTATIGFTVESPEFVTTTQIPVAHMSITAYEY